MSRMANNETAQAWMDQLKAEITLSEFGSIRQFAAALEIDYHTFRRYTSGERDIPFWLLMDSLAKLGLSFSDFEARVLARIQTGG